MDIQFLLNELRSRQEKNTVITDKDGKIVYSSPKCDVEPEIVPERFSKLPEDFDELEFFDKKSGIYLRAQKNIIENAGETYNCFTFSDISEYTTLVKEFASYTKSLKNMSRFQSWVMMHLSMPYDTFMPGLAEYCGSDDIIMLMEKDGKIVKSSYDGKISRTNISANDKCADFLNVQYGDIVDGYRCIINSSVQESRYSVLVRQKDETSVSDAVDSSIHNVISLFIENSILRDHIIYESEHDKLTGLYNKGKYMALKSTSFGKPETIAIYNFDVNNLKYINDNFGHEYGDALIIKAAKSIAAVTDEKVFGFRMGGDEYVMVGVGLSREQAEDVRNKWKNALDELNRSDESLFCAMACGMSFGSGEYDYDELYSQADGAMYVNKKELKANNIGSHLKETK